MAKTSLVAFKKYIEFSLSGNIKITVPMEKAEKFIDSNIQFMKVLDEAGNWTGETINKSHIIGTKRDNDREDHEYSVLRQQQERQQEIEAQRAYDALPEEEKERRRKKGEEARAKIRALIDSKKMLSDKDKAKAQEEAAIDARKGR